MPMTSPLLFSTAPPLLPGEIEASICIHLLLPPIWIALTVPLENVPSNPFGLPTARQSRQFQLCHY